MERLLYRLSQSEHADRFVLKGALMLQFWGAPLRRATKDIDLLGRETSNVDRLVEVVQQCLEVEVDEHGRAVARIVKRTAQAAGLDPKAVSGHALRAGLATAAALAGASERAIMNQTGHTSVRSVRRYIRDAQLFRDNAATAVL
jgi:integrase